MSLIRDGFDLLLHGQETVQQSKKIVGVEDQQIHRRQRHDDCRPHTSRNEGHLTEMPDQHLSCSPAGYDREITTVSAMVLEL